jgi:nanoRNase/pAp phosphatase (c-di-AMP/oligoRNAs hydrolase)
MRPDSHLAAIADVGGPIGATSTVVVEYVRASRLEIPANIATALFYGIKADTRDLGRQTTPQDIDAYLWLFPRTDKDVLGDIEHPPLSQDYFALSHTAIERAQVYEGAVVLPLGRLYAPDMVAEVAERFLYLEGVRWSLAWGEFDGDLYYSLRTTDRRANAGRLIREVIEGRGGSAGGHGSMAGARLPQKGRTAAARRAQADEVAEDFLLAFGVKGRTPRSIVGGGRTRRTRKG